ncbi:MAG: hypothetical protein MJ211_09620 [Bacteroidales bacterium]|nr:hypothetical protein [Bacteroidales bacterium]
MEPKISKEDFDNIVHLYQQLTLEQCRELYLQQKDTFNNKLKCAVRLVIATKYIYGENYKIKQRSENSK